MRGQFIRGDGLVVPNNVTLAGAEAILVAAFWGEPLELFAGLIQGTPGLNTTSADIEEPTIGVHGYERIELTQTQTGWPTLGTSNNEAYIESDYFVFEADGGEFDTAVQRVALFDSGVYAISNKVLMMSVLFPNEITIGPDTPESLRRFKYRLYL